MSGKAILSFIWFITNDAATCKLDKFDIYMQIYAGGIIVSIILSKSVFIFITVLYVKICIILRSRIGQQPDPLQQFRTENRERVI